MKSLSIGEFYCGPGGLGMGAKLSKIKDSDGITYHYEHSFAKLYVPILERLI